MNSRTIIIGDPHGCWAEFSELIKTLQYSKHTDRLIVAGDVLDRGPDAKSILTWMRKNNIECVMGNHDDKHLRYAKHESKKRHEKHYKNPMHLDAVAMQHHGLLTYDDLSYIKSWPMYLQLNDNWVVVHGGFEGFRPLEQQFYRAVTRIRYVDNNGRFVGSDNPSQQPPDTVHWPERYYGPYNVVYGHHVHSLIEPFVKAAAAPNVMTYGIDTGCCFGGHLSALILPTMEIVKVKAKEVYAALKR